MNEPKRRGRPPRLDKPLRVALPVEIKAALDAAARSAGVPTGRFAEILLASVGASKGDFLTAYAEQMRQRAGS